MKAAFEIIFGAGGETPASKAVRLCHSLLTERGDVSGAKIAEEIIGLYRTMNPANRTEFFHALARNFSPDPEAVGLAGDAYRLKASPQNLARLQAVVEPPRQELFRRLNTAPGATAQLVDLRAQVLAGLAQNEQWESVAADLKHLFTSWFNPGFLTLQRIHWGSPASILQRLITHEAVHAIQGFDDVRRRVAEDRRCYGYFHPSLPEEPIVFIEVALSRGMVERVQPLLDVAAPVRDPKGADTAIFYSITSCVDGLRGVPLGSFLIKQVVEDLQQSLPNLRRFATLSPVSGFAEWLRKHPRYGEFAEQLGQPGWFEHLAVAANLEKELVPLCAQYLLQAKSRQEPADSVARFHLRNGAELNRIDWLGDVSVAGMQRSYGLMVNYVYRLADIERNHEQYTRHFKIAAAPGIRSMVRMAKGRLPS